MEVAIALLTLILLEVVLGLDNVIFISIVASKLPQHQQKKARRLGLILAMFMRLGLLLIISLILKLQGSLFTIFDNDISGKDLILILGGLFLIYKSSSEIHHKMEGEDATRILILELMIKDSSVKARLVIKILIVKPIPASSEMPKSNLQLRPDNCAHFNFTARNDTSIMPATLPINKPKIMPKEL